MTKPKVGERYRVAFDFGTDPGTLKAGTVGEVVEVVRADTRGAGDDTADAYIVEFSERQAVLTDDGVEETKTARRWAATADAFTGLLEKEK